MNRKVFFYSGLGWVFDAMDVGLLSFVMAALAKNWHLTSTQSGLLGSINSLGMAIGAALFGYLADRKGRKQVFLWTVLVYSIASGLSALAPSLIVLLVLRIVIGLGLGGELPVASSYVSEFAPVSIRGRAVVMLESFWAAGWILSALIAYFLIPSYPVNGWRIAFVCAAVPALFTFFLRRGLPESPKFKKERKQPSLRVLFNSGLRKRTVVLWILWFTVVLSYYGIFLWLPSVMIIKGFTLVKGFQYVLWMTIAQLPGYFAAAYLIERWGRKATLVVFLTGTAVSSYFFGFAVSVSQLLLWGLLLNFFNLGAWGALYAYTPEQYPTEIRTTAVGIAAGIGRLGAVVGPYLVGSLRDANYSIAQIFTIFFVVTIIGALVVWIGGEETKGKEVDHLHATRRSRKITP